MNRETHQLVREIIEVTGAPGPAVLDPDAPVLDDDALAPGDGDGRDMYLVGLIGGKDVGKSALVNALVGHDITARTSFGPGTEIVIAYAHEAQAVALRALLEEAVPGQFRIETHAIPRLSRQVLLDLPDIDSHYEAHVEVTRRMLRHMLYPVWMQSVEKYADRRPQELLAAVAAGNDPRNFVFCLNKVDQVVAREGEAAVREIRDDYAARVARVLNLAAPPHVSIISATHPNDHELPGLRAMLAQQKTSETVTRSKDLAARQQGSSVVAWIERQDLPRRLERLQRAEQDAVAILAARIGQPLVEQVIPRILDDPALRLTLGDELMRKRVERWPVVNIAHVLLEPLTALVRRRLSLETQRGLEGTEQLVDVHLRDVGAAAVHTDAGEQLVRGQPVAVALQSAFAALEQGDADIARLYRHRKLWEELPAATAEIELRQRLAGTLARQREVITRRVAGRRGAVGSLFRGLLTIGAILWFPFVQPLLAGLLADGGGAGKLGLLAIQLFGVSYLIKNLGFLAIYFAGLWVVLKWDTQRKVDRALDRWKRGDQHDPSLSLTGQAMEWLTTLPEPIRVARERVEALVERTAKVRKTLAAAA